MLPHETEATTTYPYPTGRTSGEAADALEREAKRLRKAAKAERKRRAVKQEIRQEAMTSLRRLASGNTQDERVRFDATIELLNRA